MINVVRHSPKHPYPNLHYRYRYRFLAPDNDTYEVGGTFILTGMSVLINIDGLYLILRFFIRVPGVGNGSCCGKGGGSGAGGGFSKI